MAKHIFFMQMHRGLFYQSAYSIMANWQSMYWILTGTSYLAEAGTEVCMQPSAFWSSSLLSEEMQKYAHQVSCTEHMQQMSQHTISYNLVYPLSTMETCIILQVINRKCQTCSFFYLFCTHHSGRQPKMYSEMFCPTVLYNNKPITFSNFVPLTSHTVNFTNINSSKPICHNSN